LPRHSAAKAGEEPPWGISPKHTVRQRRFRNAEIRLEKAMCQGWCQ
jgi:hypothetical protein